MSHKIVLERAILGLFLTFTFGCDVGKKTEILDDLVNGHRSEFCEQLGRELASNEVEDLVASDNASLALAAHWVQVEEAAQSSGVGSVEYASKVEDLLQCLADAIGSDQLPNWWTSSFRSTRYMRENRMLAFESFEHLQEQEAISQKVEIRLNDGEHGYYAKELDVLIQAEPEQAQMIYTASGDKIYFATLPGFHAKPFEIHCYDKRRDKTVQICSVWSNGSSLVNEGRPPEPYHFARIVCLPDDNLLVFGISWQGAYVEAFDLGNRLASFRFSTKYSSDQYRP